MVTPTQTDEASAPRADVELRLPADGAYASVLRTTTAGLAARLNFTMDEIEDLRIAVGEAAALALTEADPDTSLVAAFTLAPGSIVVEIETSAIDNPAPDYDSFAWQVLDTLAQDAAVVSEQGRFVVRFTITSALAASLGAAGQARSQQPEGSGQADR